MDAYSIFKTLTKGVKFQNDFNKPKLLSQDTVKNNTTNYPIKEEIKDEEEDSAKIDNDDSKYLPSTSDCSYLTNMKVEADDYDFKRDDEVNRFRNDHNISVKGLNIPKPFRSFYELSKYNVSQQVIANIVACGYKEPTPIQMQAIPIMCEERQILACAPTGSGKTLAFLVPILNSLKFHKRQGFRALILCPTRELARQTFRECIRLIEHTQLKVHIITKVKESKFGPNFCKKFDILVSTPNRLLYLLNRENTVLCLDTVEWLVVDESDKLFETGKRGFREQLAEIYRNCTSTKIKRAMFSATYTQDVAKWCRKKLKNAITVTVGQRNTTVGNVTQELVYVGNESGKLLAVRDLIHTGSLTPPVLVFVQSKERAKELFNELIFDEINVDVIHADRTQTQRDNVVKAFREGKIWVLICTELMARGIDFKGVKLVINYDFPPSAISYIHRIGRTGRAGRPGKAVTYFTTDDKLTLRSIATVMRESGCHVPEYMIKLKRLKKSEKIKLKYKSAPDRKPITTAPKPFKRALVQKRKRSDNDHKQKDGNPNKKKKQENQKS